MIGQEEHAQQLTLDVGWSSNKSMRIKSDHTLVLLAESRTHTWAAKAKHERPDKSTAVRSSHERTKSEGPWTPEILSGDSTVYKFSMPGLYHRSEFVMSA